MHITGTKISKYDKEKNVFHHYGLGYTFILIWSLDKVIEITSLDNISHGEGTLYFLKYKKIYMSFFLLLESLNDKSKNHAFFRAKACFRQARDF